MVNLSGLSIKNKNNIDVDIEIISTGLRPGKNYMKNFINAKSTVSNPRIFKAYEESMKYFVVEKC